MAGDRIQRRIDRLLDQAEEAADEPNWQRVRELSQNILAFDPENTDALGFLAAADRSLPESASTPNSQSTSIPTISTPTTPSQPTSFANGRYQVKRFLGEGGKKKVYLAQDVAETQVGPVRERRRDIHRQLRRRSAEGDDGQPDEEGRQPARSG